jgi:hypothetical protein
MNRAVVAWDDPATSDQNSRLPRIRLKVHRTVRTLDCNTPAPRLVTRWQRIGADLVNVVTTWWARADRGLELVDTVHVDDRLFTTLADSEHRLHPVKAVEAAPSRGSRRLNVYDVALGRASVRRHKHSQLA